MAELSVAPLRCLSLAAAVVALLGSVSSLAQTASPSSIAPSRDQVVPAVPGTQPNGTNIRVDPGDSLRSAPCPLDQFDIAVAINSLSFSGPDGTPVPPAVLAILQQQVAIPAGSSRINIVCDIRDEANAALRRAGYLASVQIPTQSLEDGALRLEVITARVVDIRISGDAPPFRDQILARAETLKQLDPFNLGDAERILLQAGDIPGLDVQLSLSAAGTQPGDVIGDLIISYRPYQLVANIQNYGSRQLGRETIYARGEVYGLTGLADLTYIGASSTIDFDEQKVVQAGHLMGLDTRGTTVGINGVYAWSRPDLDLLDLRSRSWIANLEVATPLQRNRRSSIDLSAGFEMIEQTIRVQGNNGSTPLNRDRLRILYARLDGEWSEPVPGGGEAWSIRTALELRKGLNIFGATRPGVVAGSAFTQTRIAGEADAFVARFEFEGVARIMPLFSIAALAEGQYSDGPLLNFEEYSIGNLGIGRGYDPGANSGDRAVGLRAELRAHVYDAPSARVDLFAFVDNVHIWNRDPNSTENDRSLSSWGGGLRALIRPYAFAELTYARPLDLALDLPNASKPPERLLFSLTFQFSPPAR